MATSDGLQFNSSVENEIARNATKNFARMLEKAFEQYKKLWNEYLKLRKYCEDADVKIPFQLFESESDNKDAITLSQASMSCARSRNEHTSQTSPENTKTSSSVYESVSNECSSNVTSDIGDIVLSDIKSVQKQIEESKLLRSPILAKKRSKSRKSCATYRHSNLENSEDNGVCVPIKENISILANDSEKDTYKIPVEYERNECSFTENNNDEIECTPIAKMPRKLGVSKLYNVDTTLLQSGKKLKQSRLIFLPNTQTTGSTVHRKDKVLNPLRSHKSLDSKENIKKISKNRQIKSVDEEIIEGSPTKCTESNLKLKSLRQKKKSPTKVIEKNATRKNYIFDKHNDNKISSTKLPLREINQTSLSQCLLPTYTSTQKDDPYLIKSSKTASSLHNEIIESDCDILSSPVSAVLANIEHSFCEDTKYLSTPVKETKKLEITKNDNQVQKRKFSETTIPMLNYNNSTYNDETFCLLGEKLKETPTSNVGALKDIKEKISENYMSPDSPPAKRSLMNSFDIPPEKEDVYTDKPSRKKSERAKMTGIACWECKKYYANLGLSEKEIKARQNQCSRHRTKYNQRESTPEGFWDPLFPDTISSSYQDD